MDGCQKTKQGKQSMAAKSWPSYPSTSFRTAAAWMATRPFDSLIGKREDSMIEMVRGYHRRCDKMTRQQGERRPVSAEWDMLSATVHVDGGGLRGRSTTQLHDRQERRNNTRCDAKHELESCVSESCVSERASERASMCVRCVRPRRQLTN